MSRRVVTIVTCDGCGRTNEEVDMALSRPQTLYARLDRDYDTTDMCIECRDSGRYICRGCWGVHEEDWPCPEERGVLTG